MVTQSKTKKSGEDVSEAAQMFQAIADRGEVGILVLDKDDRIEFVNKMFSNITGYQQESLVGKTFTDFLIGENKEVFESLRKACVTSTDKSRQVVEIKTTTSSQAVTEMCCAHYEMHSGDKKTFVYLRDIAVQQQLTKELRKSEKRYRELFEHIDQGISISTREGKFIDCNPAILKILGYESKEEFLKLDISKDLYVTPQDRKEFQRLIEKDGYVKNYEVAFKKKNGETIPILLTTQAIKNEKGEVIGYQGLNIDISERIRMEQELREKHGFLTNLLESSADCIIVSDMRGRVIFFNKAAARLTGYPTEEVIGKFHVSKFYSLEMAREIMKKLRGDEYGDRGKLENYMLTVSGKHNEEIPVSLSASIVLT
jgi:two-component system NtrC family sensor kinase